MRPIPNPSMSRCRSAAPGRHPAVTSRRPRPSAALAARLALALGLAAAAPAAAGPAGFAFLEIPAGARAAALGGAYTTFAEGAEAAFWNPSGLAGVERLELSGSHAELVQGLRNEAFSIGLPAGAGGLAASVRALYSEAIVARDEIGNEIGTFGAHDLEFGLAYGWRHHDGLRFGLGTQVVRERIEESAATTFAFSAGGAWDPGAFPGWRLALAVQNVGPGAAFTLEDGAKGQTVALPLAVQTGVRWSGAVAGTWERRLALETRVTAGRPAVMMLGAEIAQPAGAAVRLGYRVNDDATNFTMGAGWVAAGLALDYAYVPARLDLGDTHRVSFTTRF